MDFSWLARGVAPSEIPDFAQQQARQLTLRELARKDRLGALEERERLAAYEAQQGARSIFARAQEVGWEQAIKEGAATNPAGAALALKLRKEDEKGQADIELTKANTRKADVEAGSKVREQRLKLAEKLANEAGWLAEHPKLTPEMVDAYNKKLDAVGLGPIMPAIDPSSVDSARTGLMGHSRMFFDIKDQITTAETQRHNQRTEDLTAARDEETGRHHRRTEGLSAAALAETRRHNMTSEEAGKWQLSKDGDYRINVKTGERQRVTEGGKPIETGEEKRASRAIERADLVLDRVENALRKTNFWNTGIPGMVRSINPHTDAYALRKDVETIKSNIGFQELQAMRDASPTGGALGQVAVQELNYLQASLANLDPNQSANVLRDNLNKVYQHFAKWKAAAQKSLGQQPNQAPSVERPESGWGRMTVTQ
jgi:hypothetical protein